MGGYALGVKDNQYTTETPETLSASSSKIQDAVKTRQEEYKKALAKEQEKDQLCKDAAAKVNAYFEGIDKIKEQLAQGGVLEEQLKLVESNVLDADPNLVPIEKIEEQMTKAGVSNNPHSTLTYLDAKLLFESYQKFLTVKKKNIEEEINAKRMKGISQEQYDQIDAQFKKFDVSGNKILEKNEFKACLYTLGDERGSKAIKEIMAKYSTEDTGMSYDGFKAFMLEQLGDSGTKMDMLYSFAIITGQINPNEKKKQTDTEQKELEEKLLEMEKIIKVERLVEVCMVEHDIDYLKTYAPEASGGLDYGQWIDAVFAR